jgi:hypothetical protein
MRGALLLTALVAVIGCGASAGATATTDLRISYWPEGRAAGQAQTSTLRCGPVGGTLARPAAACQKLAGMRNPFAPIPADAMCTEQYGGPQVALITGTFRGKRVWTQLQRRNGCEIGRFKQLAFLVPAFGAGASS